MAKHIVILGPVNHGGSEFHDGDEIDLDKAEAAALIAAKVVVEAGSAKRRAASEKSEDAQPAAGG